MLYINLSWFDQALPKLGGVFNYLLKCVWAICCVTTSLWIWPQHGHNLITFDCYFLSHASMWKSNSHQLVVKVQMNEFKEHFSAKRSSHVHFRETILFITVCFIAVILCERVAPQNMKDNLDEWTCARLRVWRGFWTLLSGWWSVNVSNHFTMRQNILYTIRLEHKGGLGPDKRCCHSPEHKGASPGNEASLCNRQMCGWPRNLMGIGAIYNGTEPEATSDSCTLHFMFKLDLTWSGYLRM